MLYSRTEHAAVYIAKEKEAARVSGVLDVDQPLKRDVTARVALDTFKVA